MNGRDDRRGFGGSATVVGPEIPASPAEGDCLAGEGTGRVVQCFHLALIHVMASFRELTAKVSIRPA